MARQFHRSCCFRQVSFLWNVTKYNIQGRSWNIKKIRSKDRRKCTCRKSWNISTVSRVIHATNLNSDPLALQFHTSRLQNWINSGIWMLSHGLDFSRYLISILTLSGPLFNSQLHYKFVSSPSIRHFWLKHVKHTDRQWSFRVGNWWPSKFSTHILNNWKTFQTTGKNGSWTLLSLIFIV